MPLVMKAKPAKEIRCREHRDVPLYPHGRPTGDPKQVRQATVQAAEAARERLADAGVAWTKPTRAELGSGCPSCAAAAAVAYLNGDGEPYIPTVQQRPETERPVSLPKTRTATVHPELPAPAPRRRRVGVVAHEIRY